MAGIQLSFRDLATPSRTEAKERRQVVRLVPAAGLVALGLMGCGREPPAVSHIPCPAPIVIAVMAYVNLVCYTGYEKGNTEYDLLGR